MIMSFQFEILTLMKWQKKKTKHRIVMQQKKIILPNIIME